MSCNFLRSWKNISYSISIFEIPITISVCVQSYDAELHLLPLPEKGGRNKRSSWQKNDWKKLYYTEHQQVSIWTFQNKVPLWKNDEYRNLYHAANS